MFEKLMDVGRENLEAQEKGLEFEVLLPDGLPSGCFLKIHGRDSAAFREGQRRIREKRESERRGLIEADPEVAARDDAYFLSWLVSGWRCVVRTGGKEEPGQSPAFSRESVEELLGRHPFYREQMWAWVNDRAGFTRV